MHTVYEFGGFRLDARRRLLLRADGEAIAVAGKGFDALIYLVERAGEVIPRAVLTKALWPTTVVEENSLSVVISALRRALGDEPPAQRHIVTVAGRGYQFVADVRTVAGAEPKAGALPLAPTAAPARPESSRVWMVIAAVVIVVALLAIYGVWRDTPDGASARADAPSTGLASVSRLSPVTTYGGDESTPSLSLDGNHVAFAWDGEIGNIDIYVTRIGAQGPLRLTRDAATDRDPAWSPDGDQIAFVRHYDPWQGEIIVVPALGGPERKLRSIRMRFVTPRGTPPMAWSPDGKHLLFTTQTDEQADLVNGYAFHLLSLETGVVHRLPLAGDGYDTSPAFSADGTRLAFTRYAATASLGQLMVQELGPDFELRGEPHPVPVAGPQDPRSPSWSPDSAHLVFVNGRQILEWTVGGTVRPIHSASGELAGLSMIWRDGRPLAVAAKVESDLDIWALPIDPGTHVPLGPPVRRVQSTARDEHPRFSPDGRRLAFASRRSGSPEIWVADADGQNPHQLSRFGASTAAQPRWSPDGTRLTFNASTPDDVLHVHVVDVDEGLPRLLTSGSATGWSADGQHLYVTELGGLPVVTRFRVADGHRERLLVGAGAQEGTDGTRLFYAKHNQLGIFARSLEGDVASNPEERVVDDYYLAPSAGFQPVENGIFYAGYTPDGRARALRFFDYAQRAAQDIALLPAVTIWGLAVSPDQRELLYAAPESAADLVLLEF